MYTFTRQILTAGTVLVASASMCLAQSNTFPASGNAGVGTTTPAASLQVTGTTLLGSAATGMTSGFNGEFGNPNAGNSGGFRFNKNSTTAGTKVFSSFHANSGIEFYHEVVSSTASRFIFNGGYIGVGTGSPYTRFDLRGTSATPDATLQIVGNGISTLLLGQDADGGVIRGQGGNNILKFMVGGSGDQAASASGSEAVRINAAGNVGIGTANPIDRLQITNPGDVRIVLMPNGGANNRESLIDFWSTFDNYPGDTGPRRAGRIQVGYDGYVWTTEYMAFGVGGSNDAAVPPVERMRIAANGNVGIGTANPTQKLSVNGAVRAKEVIVDTGWSDYVFSKSYKLKALSEVEEHIKAEGHLPDIPSAKEVEEHGISVGEMQAKLLAKIEELTLHVIAQEKEIKALKAMAAQGRQSK